MKAVATLVLAFLVAAAAAAAPPGGREQEVRFANGASGTTIKGRIAGYETVDYKLRAGAGQTLTVEFKPGNRSAYFDVLPPGSEKALFVGSTSGNWFGTALPAAGVYVIRVYLMRHAARRNETASYTLDLRVTGTAGEPVPATAGSLAVKAVAGERLDRTLELQGIRFRLECANAGSVNTLRITPAGLEIDNRPLEVSVDGTVTGAEVADLDGDGSPELYVYVVSAGSGSYGTLVGYAANRRKSLSGIYLPPVDGNPAAAKGYMGHDEFAVVENVLVRRFPVYRDGDTNAAPTGGTRQLQYKLTPGEAGWILQLDRQVEY
jgi:hypothetical protein